MYPYCNYLGQHDEPFVVSQVVVFVVSQVVVFVVSQPVEFFAGQQDSLTAAGAGLLTSLNAITPMAASSMIVKITLGVMLFFFGGQQLPSHSHCWLFRPSV